MICTGRTTSGWGLRSGTSDLGHSRRAPGRPAGQRPARPGHGGDGAGRLPRRPRPAGADLRGWRQRQPGPAVGRDRVVRWLPALTDRARRPGRGILVALNPAARSHDAGHVLRDSAARIAVADAAHAALFAGLQPDCPDLAEIIVAADGEPGGLSVYTGPGLPGRPDAA